MCARTPPHTHTSHALPPSVLQTIPNWTGGSLLLAEVGTVQMEFFALAHHAGRPEFRERAQRAIDLLDSQGGGLTDGGSDAAFSPPPP